MRRLLSLLTVSACLLVPAAASAHEDSLPKAHPVDLSQVHGDARLPDPAATKHIPGYLRDWVRGAGKAHAADHWAGMNVAEQQFEDQHGHVLTLATDNANVDLAPYANLLASTYHYGEIELVHAFITSGANLTEICGSDAAACYSADRDRPRYGVMIISYEDQDPTHAVIHEYGHHVDNNTYNLGRLSDCGVDGDGSRRWFFARQMDDNILENLSCDPKPGWGQLLPEVFAEDYAQLVGIPREEYHPAIKVPPPTARQKALLKKDIDSPFAPGSEKAKGRSSASGRSVFRLRTSVPVFLKASKAKGVRSIKISGCAVRGVKNVYSGNCKLTVKTKRPNQRFSFKLEIY